MRRCAFDARLVGFTLALGAVPMVAVGAEPQPANLFLKTNQTSGSGFVVWDWTGRGGLLIVTAYHVVREAQKIKATLHLCKRGALDADEVGEIGAGVDVLAWPNYDIAAIPIARDGGAPGDGVYHITDERKWSLLEAGARKIDFAAEVPERTRTLRIDAVAPDPNLCPEGVGIVAGSPRLSDLIRGRGRDVADVADEVRVLKYLSTGRPGASGGAVTEKEGGRVLALHSGGETDAPISWAISFSGLTLEPPDADRRLKVGGDYPWPAEIDQGRLAQSMGQPPSDVKAMVARWDRQRALFQGIMDRESGLGSRPAFYRPGYTVRGTYSFEQYAFPSVSHVASAGLFISAGYRRVSLRWKYVAPGGAELNDEVKQYLNGGVLELGVSLRVFRLKPVRLAFDLGGRGSLFPSLEENDWVWGGISRVRLAVTPRSGLPLAVVVEGLGAFDWFPETVRRYRGFGGTLEGLRDRGTWSAGFGAGLEFSP